MPQIRSPRKGSLQFWPRKRAEKALHRVNWNAISSGKQIKGFIGYKAGMRSAIVKDTTPDSMTKGLKIAIPVTIIEVPSAKIFSARFYKNNNVIKEVILEGSDKELKSRLKLPKDKKANIDEIKGYDDVKIILYSQVKKTGIKKTPDLIEVGLKGSLEEKIAFIKSNSNKELSVLDFFEKGQLVDIRGISKGKGLVGPVKRFGIGLKQHKSEKGQRRPGSIGPWHPRRVIFTVPMAGQMGLFSRITYNHKIIEIGKETKLGNLKNYGNIQSNYIILRGSVVGPAKNPVLITASLRETNKQKKKNFDLIELR